MGGEYYEQFLKQSQKKVSDLEFQQTINSNLNGYQLSFKKSLAEFTDIELAKSRADKLRSRVIDDLEKYITEFESNFIKNNGTVLWAMDANEAVNHVSKIIKTYNAKNVVKSRSLLANEINIIKALKKNHIKIFDTDLGDIINESIKSNPSHLINPVINFNKESLDTVVTRKLYGTKEEHKKKTNEILRENYREYFKNAEVSIIEANFLIAENGSIAISENDGNSMLLSSNCETQIILAGIEKVIPTMEDLNLLWPVYSSFSYGTNNATYNIIIKGSKIDNEKDGPKRTFLILVDNGRTNVLKEEKQREALKCIQCGACSNVCPVYKSIGGDVYNSPYPGPIGSIITPLMQGMEKFGHLSFASTLCGKCSDICPVKIDIHKLLIANRKKLVDNNITLKSDNTKFSIYKRAVKKRSNMNMFGSGMKNIITKAVLGNSWGKERELPKFAKQSFNQIWKDERG